LDPRVYDVFDSASALKLNPEVLTLTPGISCMNIYTDVAVGLVGSRLKTHDLMPMKPIMDLHQIDDT